MKIACKNVGLLLLLLGSFGTAISQEQKQDDSTKNEKEFFTPLVESVKNGMSAPNFRYVNIKGDTVSQTDFAGKVIYIDVWATWCPACIEETPHFQELEEKYADDDIVFISISIDNDKKKWRKWVKKSKMTGHQLFTGGPKSAPIYYYTLCDGELFDSSMKGYYVRIPIFVIVDQSGVIVNNMAPRPSQPEIVDILDKLLGKNEYDLPMNSTH